MGQLCDIVIAAFAGAVQKDHQGQGLGDGVSLFRPIEPIGEGVVALDVKMSLEQCGVGLLSE